MPAPVLRVDCMLAPEDFQVDLPELARCLEPFGTGNPAPLFGFAQASISDITPVGGGKHLRVSVKKGNYTIRCMRFRTTLEEFEYHIGDAVDLAVALDSREYMGKNQLSVVIREMKPSGADTDAMIAGKALYEKFRRGEFLEPEEALRLIPAREDFAAVFRALRAQNGWKGTPEMLLTGRPSSVPGMEKLLIALDVFAERGLISLSRAADTYEIRMASQSGKVNLEDAPTLLFLRSYEKAGEQNGMAAENI